MSFGEEKMLSVIFSMSIGHVETPSAHSTLFIGD